MDINSFSQMLTVSIEAFAALLGISVALYIYLHQRYWSEVNVIRKRIDSNLGRIEKAFKKLNPEFVFGFPYWENDKIEWGRHKIFLRMMEEIAKDYKDMLDQEIAVEFLGRLAREEIAERTNEAAMDMRTLEYTMSGPHIPSAFYSILFAVCGAPIVFSFFNLVLMTYGLPIWGGSGYALFAVDVVCLVLFGFLSLRMR